MGARNAENTVGRRGNALNLLVLAGVSALVGAALAKELGQPAEDRTWHGRIAGLPYDFRPPTLARVRAEFWAPDNPSLLTPHAFGIGYGLNLGRLARDLTSRER
ncbi:DUF5808 domain-containing protein [Streptacidiphilus fuscans]|uniref:DUF5808 domain-containing protein n=1 Tax=Streptacidiphilus fuscans TaxID=2789292 RepID=A0A931AXU8_9ACTN|nr:DUF5808 domain-containing protein [Streptacidiphilus fuscans]MBF9066849.1 hypothetical protein [Streptacidiphilus fuscans]